MSRKVCQTFNVFLCEVLRVGALFNMKNFQLTHPRDLVLLFCRDCLPQQVRIFCSTYCRALMPRAVPF